MGSENKPIDAAIDDIEGAVGRETTTLGTVMDSFEDRSLGAILLIFGLLVFLPFIGAIPGLPDVAALVVLIAVFHALVGGSQHFWAPDAVREKEVSADKLRDVLERARPYTRRIDWLVRPGRLGLLVETSPARLIIALSAAALAALIFVLSLVPFAASAPALALALLGLALMSRDGLFALAGYAASAAALGTLWNLWTTIFGG